uniref:Transthyretin-like family protein n=1 Tax=Acrobeloides nanus TaxID=290746 RepID=A0A914DVG9_9BILA
MCGNKPAGNVLVKLFDEDDGPDPDDLLDSGYTEPDGTFELKGDTTELTNIDPELRIYHDCNNHVLCKREWVIGIPDKYITSGTVAKKIMDIGTVNLEVELEDEDTSCIH